MSAEELENLVRIGKLKAEPPSRHEFQGLVSSAKKRLADARNEDLSPDSRFDLAYNASHALALAALRLNGYRSENRYLVFQALPHTLGMDAVTSRILARAHNERNLAEYEGRTEVDERLLKDLILCATKLKEAVSALSPPDAD